MNEVCLIKVGCYKVNKIKNADSAIQTQVKYTWTKALQSGVFDEEGNFVHIPESCCF
jgi:hypothetical protein